MKRVPVTAFPSRVKLIVVAVRMALYEIGMKSRAARQRRREAMR